MEETKAEETPKEAEVEKQSESEKDKEEKTEETEETEKVENGDAVSDKWSITMVEGSPPALPKRCRRISRPSLRRDGRES